jgi:hypothetical protein
MGELNASTSLPHPFCSVAVFVSFDPYGDEKNFTISLMNTDLILRASFLN